MRCKPSSANTAHETALSKARTQPDRQGPSFIRDRSPTGAAKVEARLTAVLHLLQQQPNIGARTRIARVRRIFIVPYPYLVDYYVGDEEIVIQRFRHTARRPLA